MALTYVSLAPNVLMGTAGLSPLQFSLVFGANGFWIMLVSFVAKPHHSQDWPPFLPGNRRHTNGVRAVSR
ncbi:Uncharacterised protein [Serratia fonticola]|uniref:Uncharacterized protein n=1 Tax=Serratia fonticola TaxID=47917 RepID=A0A4U9TF09_SERFO|nr:Uncharacterised protein [Serratia fonticola]